MNKNSSLLKFTFSSKYDMIRWIYSTNTATGFYSSILEIQINGKFIIDHICDAFYSFWRCLFG